MELLFAVIGFVLFFGGAWIGVHVERDKQESKRNMEFYRAWRDEMKKEVNQHE